MSGTVEQQFTLASIRRQHRRALELGAGLFQSSELLEQVTADRVKQVIGRQDVRRKQSVDKLEAGGGPKGHADRHRAIQLDDGRAREVDERSVQSAIARQSVASTVRARA